MAADTGKLVGTIQKEDDGTYTYFCEHNILGVPKGPGRPCGFTSIGWAQKKLAEDTGHLHEQEHDDDEPMPEKSERDAYHRHLELTGAPVEDDTVVEEG